MLQLMLHAHPRIAIPPETRFLTAAYDARAGLIAWRLNASLRHRISATLRLAYFAQVETVRGAANEDSPLVRSKQDAGVGMSLIWGAWHSAESGVE